ncbi:DUF6177 family protein [Microbacterium sp. AGC85]
MVTAVHPFADEWTDDYALFSVEHDRIAYSRPLRHFLAHCRADGLRPVLLTGEGALISPHLYTAMTESGALWAFRNARGVFDARSGLRIQSISELWTGTDASERHTDIAVEGLPVPVVLFDIYATERAVDSTLVGPLADHAVATLGGGPLTRYGRDEPLTSQWDHRELTTQVQGQMPASEVILAASDLGAWCSLTVARTRDGLIQRVHGGVPLPSLSSTPVEELRDRVMPTVTRMLSGLVDEFRPRVAMVSAGMLRHNAADFGFRVGAQPVDAPLAVLIGPRAVRDLRLDFTRLAERHDLTTLGPGRVPSALVRMTGRDALWAQLRAFAYDLDQERLGAVLATELGGMS